MRVNSMHVQLEICVRRLTCQVAQTTSGPDDDHPLPSFDIRILNSLYSCESRF